MQPNNQQQPQQTTATQVKIEPLLDEVLKRDASDLHLQSGLPAMLRIDGGLIKVENPVVLKPADIKSLIYSVLDDQQKKILEEQ